MHSPTMMPLIQTCLLPRLAAGLWDMSLLAAVRGEAVHWSLPLVVGAQGFCSLAIMLSVIPAVISQLPVHSEEAEL